MIAAIKEHLHQIPQLHFTSKTTAQNLSPDEVKTLISSAFLAISGKADCPSFEKYIQNGRPFQLSVAMEKVRTRIYLIPIFNGIAMTSRKCEFTFEVEHQVVLC